MALTARRTQWPIGQGSFSSGTLSHNKTKFEYVYDCGSTDISALRGACDALQPSAGVIDALFVSHLDSDHVNGIDMLTTGSGYSITNLFLPYLTDLEAIILLAEGLAGDSLTGDFISFLEGPLSWAATRGISGVSFIGRGRDPEAESNERTEEPRDPREKPWRPIGPQEGAGQEKARFILRVSCNYDSRSKDSASGIEWTSYPGRVQFSIGGQRIPDWYLVPFVPPLPAEAVSEFLKAVAAIGIQLQPGNSAQRKLLDIVRDKARRKSLKGCYELLASNHNYVSMCLYSGPFKYNGAVRMGVNPWPDHGYLFTSPNAESGWLGTGDAPLRVSRIYDSFSDKYADFLDSVAVVMCPHHGSRHNFNSRLLTDTKAWLCFASHGKNSPYGHPHADVVRKVHGTGREFHGVTEDPTTRLVERIELA